MHHVLSRRRFVLAGSAAFASVVALPIATRAAEFALKCSSSQAVDHPNSVRLAQMWAAVKRETNGRLDVVNYPNSQLGGDAAMLGQVRLGATAFSMVTPGNLAPVIPAVDIVNLGYIYSDAEEGLRSLVGPFGDFLRSETRAKGLIAVDLAWDSGMFDISSGNRPIRAPDDLHGFKIRTSASRITVEMFKTLGASPTPLSVADTYTGLQTKLLDGASITVVSLELFGWYAVQKYASLTNHTWASMWIIANDAVWNGLPADLQAAVLRNAKKYGALERRDIKLLTAAVQDKLVRQGVALNPAEAAPFRQRLKPYYESMAKDFGPKVWGTLETAVGRKLT